MSDQKEGGNSLFSSYTVFRLAGDNHKAKAVGSTKVWVVLSSAVALERRNSAGGVVWSLS